MRMYAAALMAILAFLSINSDASAPPAGNPVPEAQVVSKSKKKTRYVVRRTRRGGKWVYIKTRVKSRPVRQKTWRTGRKAVSRTKKVFK
jgi:hypothetical protein